LSEAKGMVINMNDNIDPFASIKINKSNLNIQIADQIQEMIEAKTIKLGAKLPSERSLAVKLGVNRATLRESIRILEQRGLLKTDTGKGAYISFVSSTIVTESIKRYRIFGNCSPEEIMVLREIIEPEICALAAINADSKDLEILKEQSVIVNKKFKEKNREEYIMADEIFHEKLTDATKNELLKAIMKGLRVVILPIKQSIISKFWIDNKEEHKKIYDTIYAKNTDAAREAMKKHISTGRYYFNLKDKE